MLKVLLIPAEAEKPVEVKEIGDDLLTAFQSLVDGDIEAIGLNEPPAVMYMNEEGKLRGLPYNDRATVLLWQCSPAFRNRDFIAGACLIVGLPDDNGNDTDCPEEYRALAGVV